MMGVASVKIHASHLAHPLLRGEAGEGPSCNTVWRFIMSPNDVQGTPLTDDKEGPSSLSSKCPPFAEGLPPRESPSLTSIVNVPADAAGARVNVCFCRA